MPTCVGIVTGDCRCLLLICSVRFLQIAIDFCHFQQIAIDFCQFLQIAIDLCRFL